MLPGADCLPESDLEGVPTLYPPSLLVPALVQVRHQGSAARGPGQFLNQERQRLIRGLGAASVERGSLPRGTPLGHTSAPANRPSDGTPALSVRAVGPHPRWLSLLPLGCGLQGVQMSKVNKAGGW